MKKYEEYRVVISKVVLVCKDTESVKKINSDLRKWRYCSPIKDEPHWLDDDYVINEGSWLGSILINAGISTRERVDLCGVAHNGTLEDYATSETGYDRPDSPLEVCISVFTIAGTTAMEMWRLIIKKHWSDLVTDVKFVIRNKEDKIYLSNIPEYFENHYVSECKDDCSCTIDGTSEYMSEKMVQYLKLRHNIEPEKKDLGSLVKVFESLGIRLTITPFTYADFEDID